MFRFIHAADIHLDSPLKGLERYDGAPADQVRRATRQSFQRLVQLAIDQEVAFLLIAGDLYDGDWKDYHTGLFFVSQMARLREAGIPAYCIAGNHDAANRMTKSLRLPDNVRMLSHQRPESVMIESCGVALHGQSFATAAVTDDLAAAYPAAARGCFNIGLLHTCATGREGHESYAPCTIDGLRSRQYDYWALGHVHQREVLCNDPPIVFAGNTQGRHIRETGPKGCSLVTVDDAGQPTIEPFTLDVVRWERCTVDATGAESPYDILPRLADQLRALIDRSNDLPLMVRVSVVGACRAHEKLTSDLQSWTNEIRAQSLDVGRGRVWIEKVQFDTSLPRNEDRTEWAEGPMGELVRLIEDLETDGGGLADLDAELADLRKKLPVELTEGADRIELDSTTLRGMLGQVRSMLVQRLVHDQT